MNEPSTTGPPTCPTVLYREGLTGSERLRAWLAARNGEAATFRHTGGRRFRHRWNHLARAASCLIAVDYPIEDDVDLRTLEAFAAHVSDRGGAWYYAVRPNAYVGVDGAALVGMAPPQPLRRRLGDALGGGVLRLGRRVLASRWLPGWMRRTGQRVGVWVLSRLSRTGDADGTTAPASTAAPQELVPSCLESLQAPWQPWEPGADVLKRDLVDRVHRFFPHPASCHVIVLNRCNLRCYMCPYHSERYRPHHTSDYFAATRRMSEDVFRTIASYAGRHGIGLQFGQIEEPLLHPSLFEFFRQARRAGVPRIHLTTNGTLLDAPKAEALARSGVDSVMFSIDAVTPEAYREIRGSDLEDVEAKIRHFLPMAKKRGIWVTASFILQPQAGRERDRFLEKWRDLGVHAVTFYQLSEHDLDTGAMIRTGDFYDPGRRYVCASPWVQAVIFPDGEVSLCCKTMVEVGWRGVVSVGDLRQDDMDTVWTGPGYQAVREELIRNRFETFDVCADCRIWSATSSLKETGPGFVRQYNETMETFTFT